ncbi:MAG TPA: PQQ-binding-like beta-propeller repeat protein [Polyangiaceae bacterium]
MAAILVVVCASCGELLPNCPTPDGGTIDASSEGAPAADGGLDAVADSPLDASANDSGNEGSASACPPRVHSGSTAVTYQIDVAHTGSQPLDTIALPLCKRWSATLMGKATYPLIANGAVYVTGVGPTGAATLYAFDIDTGTKLWGPVVAGTTSVGLAYDNGKIFTLVEGPAAVGYDAANGQTLWVTALEQINRGPSVGATAVGGTDYFSDGSGSAFALDETTGAVLWQQYTVGQGGSPAIVGGTCFESAGEETAYAFDVTDGGAVWQDIVGIDGSGFTSPVYQGRFYEWNKPSGVVVDSADGGSIGTFSTETTPAFGGSSVLYVNGGVVSAVDIASGAPLWTYGTSVSIAPITVGGQVVVATSAGEVVVLDGSGNVLSSDNTGAAIAGSDSIGMAAADGVLAVPVGDTLVVY